MLVEFQINAKWPQLRNNVRREKCAVAWYYNPFFRFAAIYCETKRDLDENRYLGQDLWKRKLESCNAMFNTIPISICVSYSAGTWDDLMFSIIRFSVIDGNIWLDCGWVGCMCLKMSSGKEFVRNFTLEAFDGRHCQ